MRHPIWTILASVIIGITLYVVINILVAERIRQDTDDIHVLASELLNELGPEFNDESKRHAEIIKKYTDHLKQRHLAILTRIIYPAHSPGKLLTRTAQKLENATTDEDARNAIWESGVEIDQLRMKAERFPRSPIELFDSEDLPEWLLNDLDEALADSAEMVDKLENEKTKDAAGEACRANRKSVLLLFLARLGHYSEEKIKSFLSDVKRARDLTLLLANAETNKEEQNWLYGVAGSEDRRVKILEVMLANDMGNARKLLRESIEKAFMKYKLKSDK